MTNDDLLALKERLLLASTQGYEVACAEAYADKLEALGAEKPESAATAESLSTMVDEVLAGAQPAKKLSKKEEKAAAAEAKRLQAEEDARAEEAEGAAKKLAEDQAKLLKTQAEEDAKVHAALDAIAPEVKEEPKLTAAEKKAAKEEAKKADSK